MQPSGYPGSALRNLHPQPAKAAIKMEPFWPACRPGVTIKGL